MNADMNSSDRDRGETCCPFRAELIQKAIQAYEVRFGEAAEVVVAAPGRVNLIGEHVDYNDGFVLPMGIQRYVVIAGAVSDPQSSEATIVSVDLESETTIPLDVLPTPGDPPTWASYLEGVVVGVVEAGVSIPAFNAVIVSNVPLGSGLSSSAALEVATATLLEAVTGHEFTPLEKAVLCQQAEHRFASVPCGIMDQMSSVFARRNQMLLIDCRANQVQWVPFDGTEVSVLIVDSGVRHQLADGAYALRRQRCEQALEILGASSWRDVTRADLDSSKLALGEELYPVARHVVSEIARTVDAANAVGESDWEQLGKLMDASHTSLRYDFQVSCPELDMLVEIANQMGPDAGVFGARMTGGGFGGCAVMLVDSARDQQVMDQVLLRYRDLTGRVAEAFLTRPASGAQHCTF